MGVPPPLKTVLLFLIEVYLTGHSCKEHLLSIRRDGHRQSTIVGYLMVQ